MKFNQERHIFRSEKFKSEVAEALDFIDNTPIPLPPEFQFYGVGVYALYYSGDFSFYKDLAQKQGTSSTRPIYVGKAVPPGWRTARINVSTSSSLYNRLREHARSIKQVKNLKIQDFKCKFMILINVENDLIVPVEAELIRKYRPLENKKFDFLLRWLNECPSTDFASPRRWGV